MRISDWSSDVCSSDLVNARRITNVGTFRAYMNAYLKDRGDMADGMFLVVRQLAPTETGLPLEIYAYTANTSWAVHEDVQGDTFDHRIAILPEFGLRLFQIGIASCRERVCQYVEI